MANTTPAGSQITSHHSPGDYRKIQGKGLCDFLRQHWDGLKTSKLESLDRLIQIFIQGETQTENRNLLLGMGNLLEERSQAG